VSCRGGRVGEIDDGVQTRSHRIARRARAHAQTKKTRTIVMLKISESESPSQSKKSFASTTTSSMRTLRMAGVAEALVGSAWQ
jgi:hypothetical protein